MNPSNQTRSRKEARMLELVSAELDRTTAQKEWCRLHGVSPWTIRYWRRRFLQTGLLSQARPLVRPLPPPPGTDPLVFSFPDLPVPLHLAAEPLGHPSIDKCAAVISFRFHLDPFSGGLFLFAGRGRRCLYALRWCGSGFAFLCRRLEQGRFPWPGRIAEDGTVGLSETQLHELASVFDPSAEPCRQKYRTG